MSSRSFGNIPISEPLAMVLLVSFLFLMSALLNTIRQVSEKGLFTAKRFIFSSTTALSTEAQPEPTRTALWFRIPDWLAGKWQATSETIIDAYDYRLGRRTVCEPMIVDILRTSTIGAQRDNQGRVWHCASTPYERNLESGSFVDRQSMEGISLMLSSADQLTVAGTAKVTRTNKDDGHVDSVFREETITTYRPVSAGTIQASFIINDFDMQGHPLISSRAMCYETRIDPFAIVDQDERGDLRLEFQKFLAAKGLADSVANR